MGQFSYKTENPNNIKEYICIGFGYSYVYVGQLKAGTNRASGVGIKVWEDRDTLHLNYFGVFKRESGRMIALMGMGGLQSCWCWNALYTILYHNLNKWYTFKYFLCLCLFSL